MAFPKKLRLWGIGGVGMSAIAQHLLQQGHIITGYDREPSIFTQRLEALGIPIDYEPNPEAAAQAEGIIYTPAIPSEFPERSVAESLALPQWRRAQALAEIVHSYDVLAVAGAHGKTTTTAILTWLLHRLGESPTAFVGGFMRNFASNYLFGRSRWAVVEADEYDRAMLLLQPAHAIIQSTEADHLEIYGSPEELLKAYKHFAQQVKGVLVLGPSVPDLEVPALRYSLEGYEMHEGKVRFHYRWDGRTRTAEWQQIGRHFAENAAAALTLMEAIGFDFEQLQKALSEFVGVERRLNVFPAGRHIVVSDYAHHPTEIRRTLEAIRQAFPTHKLVAIFQPHLYSRTVFFAQEFAHALSEADLVILLPIYAAREPSTPHVSSRLISQHLTVPYREIVPLGTDMSWFESMPFELPAVFAFMGAGDVDRWVLPAYDLLTKMA
ncbi:MAG: UDP-N-acetylmuramate--L-alanine ligase [Bacteroidia bacterium]|nr:UDP-N-acetylmuramate--L-alanine ligase [Bacteroidia bacterium]MCX7763799.1 UDP-N-acetylmuramate--L-alanine ligase [Bacteroidia bacterium]MDW8056928.1 cyanophycin synthetase [Bacteroidia bacterium]